MIACDCEVCRSFDPKDKRLRTSILIEENDTVVAVDAGPDFRQQMLRENVTNLDAIVFTHAHKDHTGGLDDVRAFNYRLKKPMQVFADEPTLKVLKTQYDYAFHENPYPGSPKLETNLIGNRPFSVCGIEFAPIDVLHKDLPVKGFRLGDFTYITDANYISKIEKKKIAGSKILVLNALRKTKHYSHFSLEEAIELSKELGAEQTWFTHISHQLGRHTAVSKELAKGVFLAYDGLRIEVCS